MRLREGTVKNYLIIALMFFCFPAFAGQDKYCAKGGKKVDIHLFGHTYENDSQRKLALQGLTKLKKDFAKGTNIRVFSHTPSGLTVSFDSCVPGCTESSLSEQFFSGDCSAQVAKRDSIEFDRKFSFACFQNITGKHGTYDIFQAIQSLTDVYKNTQDQSNVFAVISMVPKGVNPASNAELSALYVKKSESIAFPKSFPPVQLIGAANNEELIRFWTDVFRNKAKFNFQGY
jgi:hypothetical protein